MKLKLSRIFGPIALVAFLQLPPVCSVIAQEEGTRRSFKDGQITIRVHDYAQIKSAVLLRAEQSADDILREAGVEANWVECRVGETPSADAACARPMTSLDFILNLLPRSMAKRSDFRNNVFGFAVEGAEEGFGFYASVFYDNVKDCATHEHYDLTALFGHVIAHELGHLLMGIHSHAERGLMRASWSSRHLYAAERRSLAFSPSETERLQIGMARRQAALRGPENRSISGSP